MKYLMDMVGFKEYSIGFYHGLDISNLIYWLKLGKPTGKISTNSSMRSLIIFIVII